MKLITIVLIFLAGFLILMFTGLLKPLPGLVSKIDYETLEQENVSLSHRITRDSTKIAHLGNLLKNLHKEKDSIDLKYEESKKEQEEWDSTYQALKDKTKEGISLDPLIIYRICDSLIANRDVQIFDLCLKVNKRDEIIRTLEESLGLNNMNIEALTIQTKNLFIINQGLEEEVKDVKKEVKSQKIQKWLAVILAVAIAGISIAN